MDANPDFRDLFRTLNDAGVRYLVVGAHAVAFHAEPRYTKDLDIWVDPSPENAPRIWRALSEFGAPLKGVSVADFSDPEMVYQMGIEPNRIDVIMGLLGVRFESAWRHRVRSTYGEVPIYILGKPDLIRNKRAVGRPQDLLDTKRLTRPSSGKRRTRRKRR